jgi:hypothetical protein
MWERELVRPLEIIKNHPRCAIFMIFIDVTSYAPATNKKMKINHKMQKKIVIINDLSSTLLSYIIIIIIIFYPRSIKLKHLSEPHLDFFSEFIFDEREN